MSLIQHIRHIKITELFGSVIFIYFAEFIYSATVFAGSVESIQ